MDSMRATKVDLAEDGDTLRIVRVEDSQTRGRRLVRRMRGGATTSMTADQLLELAAGAMSRLVGQLSPA